MVSIDKPVQLLSPPRRLQPPRAEVPLFTAYQAKEGRVSQRMLTEIDVLTTVRIVIHHTDQTPMGIIDGHIAGPHDDHFVIEFAGLGDRWRGRGLALPILQALETILGRTRPGLRLAAVVRPAGAVDLLVRLGAAMRDQDPSLSADDAHALAARAALLREASFSVRLVAAAAGWLVLHDGRPFDPLCVHLGRLGFHLVAGDMVPDLPRGVGGVRLLYVRGPQRSAQGERGRGLPSFARAGYR